MSLFSILVNVAVTIILMAALTYLRKTAAEQGRSREQFKQIQSQLDDLARQNEQLQRDINTDGLTKVGNRAHFDVAFSMEWDGALRGQTDLGMLLIDIDNFKLVNDEHGHPFGDQCLIAVALAIRGCLHRVSDRVMRYGGEEFAVLLSHTDQDGTKLMAHRVLQAVRDLEFERNVHMTVSIGASSVVPVKGMRSRQFLEAVDNALYSAKHRGRNRVEMISGLVSQVDAKSIATPDSHPASDATPESRRRILPGSAPGSAPQVTVAPLTSKK